MKRSNRLVLLVGVFLAIIAFVGILLLARGNSTGGSTPTAAAHDRARRRRRDGHPALDADHGGRADGDHARSDRDPAGCLSPTRHRSSGRSRARPWPAAPRSTSATTSGGSPGQIGNLECPATLRCMAVQVDQVSGVGTVIKTGDYVDMVVGLTDFPVTTINPTDKSITVVSGLNSTSVKLLLQGLQVMGTLLPPVAPAPDNGTPASPAPSGTHERTEHGPQRPAGDRGPGGQRPAVRSPQVRPDGRQRDARPAIAQ